MLKAKPIFVVGLMALLFASPVFAQGTTRVTFSHEESFSWGDSRTSGEFTVDWNLTITGNVTFPVDFNVFNNETIDAASDDEVNYKLLTPENEGEVVITTIGSINVTKGGIIPVSGYREVENTTSLAVTTPLGEWEMSFPIPIPVSVGPITVIVTIIPTLYINASIVANATVQGPASIPETELGWFESGDVETITVHCSSGAQIGEEITLTVKDFEYFWNAEIDVEMKLEGIHLITSPRYSFKTYSIPADDDITVPFNIQVIPEFTVIGLMITLILATSAVLILKRG